MSVDLSLGAVTNMSQTIDNTGGSGVTLPSATTTNAGLMSADDKSKIILQGGNTFGSDMVIGTKDNKSINFLTFNNVESRIMPNGYYYGPGISYYGGTNNSKVNTNVIGTIISRNIADGNAALTVNQQNQNSTGNLITLQKNTNIVAQINTNGSTTGLSIKAQGSDTYSNAAIGLNAANTTGIGPITGGNTFLLENNGTPQLTVDYQGDITVLGTVKGTPGMGPLSLYAAPGVKVSSGGYGAVFNTPYLTADRAIILPDANGTSSVINTTAPASASDIGAVGEIRVTSTYVYVCIATDTWVRAPFATW
ncbi:hypothetical protein F0919_07085 [Taibaiella lutea]|uniref:Uncharacterized protein n=1 Tax=Taibaiella lutea TaxID=2608001 RepID=A0A5M6CTY0_9BACT|nr:hypothetical protein [Taibaiella lutea]KAA5537432.1 hypothetical protein F0919_07085 [Taibaiella lutea]